jgi:hypothetical protein
MTDGTRINAGFRIGTTYRTRDRREARLVRIALEKGLIFGDVQMHGACVWHSDGRYRDAPFGAAGPLDLVAPAEGNLHQAGPKIASLKEALEDDNRLFCCD